VKDWDDSNESSGCRLAKGVWWVSGTSAGLGLAFLNTWAGKDLRTAPNDTVSDNVPTDVVEGEVAVNVPNAPVVGGMGNAARSEPNETETESERDGEADIIMTSSVG
jgi:hypothetical protein